MSVLEMIDKVASSGAEMRFKQSDDGAMLECRIFDADGREYAKGYSGFDEHTDQMFVSGLGRFLEDKQ